MNSSIVDPNKLMVVKIREGRKRPSFVVCSIEYVVAVKTDGTQVIVVELIYDSKKQKPKKLYECVRFQSRLIDPNALVLIEPYVKRMFRRKKS